MVVEPFKSVYLGEFYTGQMLEFIEEGQAEGKPWFAYLAFNYCPLSHSGSTGTGGKEFRVLFG